MERSPGRNPPFASGKVAGSYDLLYAYWRGAREAGREDLVERAMLHREDYERLETLLHESGERISLLDLLDKLTSEFEERVNAELAARVAASLGYRVGAEDARRLIARLLAAWLIEAGEYWSIVKLTWGSWASYHR